MDADLSIALGEMEMKKREIIARLQKEGLFEKNKQCFVPFLPLNIGLITSARSAAYGDFIKTLADSKFAFKVYLADSMMQGDQAEKSIIFALDVLCQLKVELILIARGGGSKTDLYHLDNEAIARKIANCNIPVWTGIGHEIDKSVLDYVANRSFKTPTAIAEELIARFVQMRRQLDESVNSLKTVWTYRLKNAHDYIRRSITGINQGPRKLLDTTAVNLSERTQRLRLRIKESISANQIHVRVSKEKLRLKPISIIQKNNEHLELKKHNLRSRGKIILSASFNTVTGLKSRFQPQRFSRRIKEEHDRLSEHAQRLRLRIKESISANQIHVRVSKEKLRLKPISIIQKNNEHLELKKHNLRSRGKIILSASFNTVTGLKSRFQPQRFSRRIKEEHDRNSKVNLQLKNRFLAFCNVKRMHYQHLRDRVRAETIQQRIAMERRSLNDKMAMIKASDPQNALMRGFALVHGHDGKLIRSIHDVIEKDLIYTRLVNGSLTSKIISKENNCG